MRKQLLALAGALTLAACATGTPAPPPPPPSFVAPAFIAAAVGDPARPEADTKRDADRLPAEMLVFAGVKPGAKIGDLVPGGGYFTRLFSAAVGPTGKVYAYVPDELTKRANRPPSVAAIAADPHYKNVQVILRTLPQFGAPEKLDIVWTSQNYHDMHTELMGPADLSVVNKAVFRALKPGGVFIVLDHAAKPGSGLANVADLHRIDPAQVRREVEAAGFVFEGESTLLRNPQDDHTLRVFDPALRGHTDQFIYRFRKPRNAR